jgi:3D (Asp-Asp-Asp) domain-containing protein
MIKTSYAYGITIIPMLLITWYFSGMMDEYHAEQIKLQERVWELEDNCGLEYSNKISYKVTVTTYNPTRAQCDDTPNITADGTRIKPWKATEYRYVALSRDLLSRWGGPFDYGDYIVIEGTKSWDGVYQVRDTMNPKWTNRVDILTTNSRFKYNNITMYKYTDEEFVVTDNNL